MFLAIVSAILLILSFPNFNLSYLVFVSLVPLFFALRKKTPKKAFFISFSCGFIFYLGIVHWLSGVTLPGLLVLCFYLALYFGIFGLLFAKLYFYAPKLIAFSASFVWMVLEFLQSTLFSGFGWGLLGYSQYKNLPFIQIADFSGAYGVSFVIMFVNVSLWQVLSAGISNKGHGVRQKDKKNLIPYLLSLIAMLTAVYSYGFVKMKDAGYSKNLKVSVVQGNIPQEMKWDMDKTDFIFDRYVNLTRKAAFDTPDLIIWPETSFPGFFGTDVDLTDRLFGLAREVNSSLLIGANREDGLKNFNSAVLISGEGETVDKYDKIHLVPFGEFVPFADKFPILHMMVLGDLGHFSEGSEFTVFKDERYPVLIEFKNTEVTSKSNEYRFSVLICFEDVFPALARKFVKKGAEFLVVITNDAWYGKSAAPYQHAACSVFRAIENRVPVVRCANTGYSCFIDSKGKIYDSVEERKTHLFITGYKTSNIKI